MLGVTEQCGSSNMGQMTSDFQRSGKDSSSNRLWKMGKIFVPHKPDKKEDVEADVIGRVKEWSREAESGVWELRLGEGKEQKTKVRKIDCGNLFFKIFVW